MSNHRTDRYVLVYSDPDGMTKSIRAWPRGAGMERLATLKAFASQVGDEGHWSLHKLGDEEK